jgi:predicted aldo/keto reductase-like oxidoreductase
LGKALKDGYRKKVTLADKSPVFFIQKKEDFNRFLEEQLKRLNEEHIDFYLLHSLSRESFEDTVLKFDIIGEAERAKKAGKIGHIGFSFHDNYPAFEQVLNGWDGWEFCQIQLNYLDEEKQAGLKGLRAAAAKGLGVVIMEPLLGGKLANPPAQVRDIFGKSARQATPVQWALEYLWNMSEVSLVLSGMSSMQQTVDNVSYAASAQAFKAADSLVVSQAKEKFASMIAVPCTGCGYCMPCPQGVSIPTKFEAYNDFGLYGENSARATYGHMIQWQGPETGAEHCIGCGVCESKCPQKIQISAHMPNVAKAFAKK